MKYLLEEYLLTLVGTFEYDMVFANSDITSIEIIDIKTNGCLCTVNYEYTSHDSDEPIGYNDPIIINVWNIIGILGETSEKLETK